MKRICILSAVNIRHMSLISLYTSILKKYEVGYDIIYMDKYGEEEEVGAKNRYRYVNIIKSNWPKWRKVLQYLKFRRYATRILTKNQYDFVIVWNDVAIFLFADYLARKYKNKYCLNVRDYCSQHIKWVYNRFDKAIGNANFTTLSSEGYKKFLPSHDYYVIHSLNPILFNSITPKRNTRKEGVPIRIGFIGYVRFFELNQSLLQLFKNDERFELHYYGTKASVLEKYAHSNGINNAVFYDTFPVQDTPKFLDKIDVINNLYGNDRIGLTTALSIKLYHGVYTRIPILVCPNTYMEDIVVKYSLGFVFTEISENYKNKFYDWYRKLNFEKFNSNCTAFLDMVNEQNAIFENKFKEIIAG